MITVGTKAAIMPSLEYNNGLVGKIGTVKGRSKNKIKVQFDNCINPYDKYGFFEFAEDSLAVIPDTKNIERFAFTGIKQIIYSGPKTIILWADDTKTIVTCGAGDTSIRNMTHILRRTKNEKKIFHRTRTSDLHNRSYWMPDRG